MTNIAIAPTIERLRKSTFEAPTVERSAVRRAYRVQTTPERLAKSGDISREQLEACNKFERHYVGSLGVDVGDDDTRHGDQDVVEYSQTYHAQKIAQAKGATTENEFGALILICQTDMLVEDIGRHYGNWSCKRMCRGYAIGLIQGGTDRLIRLWGMRTGEP